MFCAYRPDAISGGAAAGGACYARGVTDDEARRSLMEILDRAVRFKSLADAIEAAYAAPDGHVIFGQARRFIETRDPSGLDAGVRARFAKALSRMTDEADTVTSHAAALRGR
jgi:hypothetical protein